MAKGKGSKASAILELTVGEFTTAFKLLRIQSTAESPSMTLTHSCRGEVSTIDCCPHCHEIVRITGVQKTGIAKEKPATEPKDIFCPSCLEQVKAYESVYFCGSCDCVIEESEIETRLALDEKTVQVTREQLELWNLELPSKGQFVPKQLTPVNFIEAALRDDPYQLIPQKGHALKFRAWLDYLSDHRLALIGHFLMQEKWRVGAIYMMRSEGEPILLLHTLVPSDQMNIHRFELPQVPEHVVLQLAELLTPYRAQRFSDALKNPQRELFKEFFEVAEVGGTVEPPMHSALPGELHALSIELSESLKESPKKKKKEE